MFVQALVAAAQATTATEKLAFDDWKWLVPVVTLVLGFALKWLQDAVTERSRDRKAKDLRREMRLDALRERQATSERASLLELQPLITDLMSGVNLGIDRARLDVIAGRPWHVAVGGEGRELARKASQAIAPIRTRLHDRNLADQIESFTAAANFALKAPAMDVGLLRLVEAGLKFETLHEAVGAAIRRVEAAELLEARGATEDA